MLGTDCEEFDQWVKDATDKELMTVIGAFGESMEAGNLSSRDWVQVASRMRVLDSELACRINHTDPTSEAEEQGPVTPFTLAVQSLEDCCRKVGPSCVVRFQDGVVTTFTLNDFHDHKNALQGHIDHLAGFVEDVKIARACAAKALVGGRREVLAAPDGLLALLAPGTLDRKEIERWLRTLERVCSSEQARERVAIMKAVQPALSMHDLHLLATHDQVRGLEQKFDEAIARAKREVLGEVSTRIEGAKRDLRVEMQVKLELAQEMAEEAYAQQIRKAVAEERTNARGELEDMALAVGASARDYTDSIAKAQACEMAALKAEMVELRVLVSPAKRAKNHTGHPPLARWLPGSRY